MKLIDFLSLLLGNTALIAIYLFYVHWLTRREVLSENRPSKVTYLLWDMAYALTFCGVFFNGVGIILSDFWSQRPVAGDFSMITGSSALIFGVFWFRWFLLDLVRDIQVPARVSPK